MPITTTLVHSNYYTSNPAYPLVIEIAGELTTDLYGLSTCTMVAKAPPGRYDLVPALFSAHPIFPYVNAERQRLTVIKDGFLQISVDYAGINGATVPIYELCVGLGEEPIETHPNALAITGSPSAPANGAIFVDFETGAKTTDDSRGVFKEFAPFDGGSLNAFAGIHHYLDFGQIIWRERYYTTARPSDASNVGIISYPSGPVPVQPSGGNWLYMGLTYEQRGLVYGVTREWKGSGFRGWNPLIYTHSY